MSSVAINLACGWKLRVDGEEVFVQMKNGEWSPSRNKLVTALAIALATVANQGGVA